MPASITASGFSSPSTILVCNAEYTSLKLMLVGDAPSALNMLVQSGLTGTRIFIPLKSVGCMIGLVLVVVCPEPVIPNTVQRVDARAW